MEEESEEEDAELVGQRARRLRDKSDAGHADKEEEEDELVARKQVLRDTQRQAFEDARKWISLSAE